MDGSTPPELAARLDHAAYVDAAEAELERIAAVVDEIFLLAGLAAVRDAPGVGPTAHLHSTESTAPAPSRRRQR